MRRLFLAFALLCPLLGGVALGQHYPNLSIEYTYYAAWDNPNYAWIGPNTDWCISCTAPGVYTHNSNEKAMIYALDWTTANDDPANPWTPPHGTQNIENEWYLDAASWATANSVNIENLYLHTGVGYTLPVAGCWTWTSSCSYVAGNLVTDGTVTYWAVQNNTNQTPSPYNNGAYWGIYSSGATEPGSDPCPTPSATNAACRLAVGIWHEWRWATNPGNASSRAYQVNRASRIRTDGGTYYTVYWDEFGTGMMGGVTCWESWGPVNTIEYGASGASCTNYYADIVTMLAAQKTALGVPMQINTANYSAAADISMAAAAGSNEMEMTNDLIWNLPMFWSMVDSYIAGGSIVAFNADWPVDATGGPIPASMTAGNYDSIIDRYQMSVLTSHYMAMPTGSFTGNYIFSVAPRYDFGGSVVGYWPAAIGVSGTSLGTPTQTRQTGSSGTDGAGQSYQFYTRTFTGGMIVFNASLANIGSGNFGDVTAKTYTLPAGSWRLLNANGTTTPVSGSIQLRMSEGVILMSGTTPTGAVLTSGKFLGVFQ